MTPWHGIEHRRAAIVAGLRTPFVKSGTVFRTVPALELGASLVAELVQRAEIDPAEIDRVVFGEVVPRAETSNVAREVLLAAGLPPEIDAFSVTRACATSTEALVQGARAVLFGEADVVVVGGTESLSRPPITFSDTFVDALLDARAEDGLLDRARQFARIRPGDLTPRPPAIAERSTGLTMGESAEKMAKENDIGREDQDRFALRSHERAVAAWEGGVYDQEVVPFPIPPDFAETVERDRIPRPDTSLEKLAKLPPVFDRRHGSVTAGNSSPLTDGAAALVVMEEDKARALGHEPLASVRSWAFSALDPGWQLLMGPSFATPVALDRAGMKLDDLDLIDMHEAFAAQMLSNLQAFASPDWAQRHLGRQEPIGDVPDHKLNIYGGSIALGHPFAATGARQVLTMANELARRGGGTALITQCAAGGLGAAVILER